MQTQQQSIMAMIDVVFQNIGYCRWISGIEVFQNQQIYLEICHFIFPESSIQMIRINESSLTTGQKIQQLIKLIQGEIRMNLSHISGHQIAKGNLQHLQNLLQLFVELTNHILKQTQALATSSVKSAPEKFSVQEENDNNIVYHTAMGISQEFIKTESQISTPLYQKSQSQPSQLFQQQQLPKRNMEYNKNSEHSEYQPDYMKGKGFPSNNKVREVVQQEEPQQIDKKNVTKIKRSPKLQAKKLLKYPLQDPSTASKKLMKDPIASTKINYMRKTNTILVQLDKKKLKDLAQDYKNYDVQIHEKTEIVVQGLQKQNSKICTSIKKSINKSKTLKKHFEIDASSFQKQLKRELKKNQVSQKKKKIQLIRYQKQKLNRLIQDQQDFNNIIDLLKQ